MPAAALAPVPASGTDCVWELLPEAATMLSAPVRCPTAVGVKVIAIAQLAPPATDVPHVFVCAKSPDVATLVMLTVAAPPLVSVTVCGALVLCMV